MGTYLSTPVTEKCDEEGEFGAVPLAWGVVDMQGWRKSMEDAHVATTEKDFQVFGVFDGHGGPEVARMCQLYLVSVLTQQPTWKQALENEPYDGNPAESPLGLALRESFHALDRIIGDPNRRDELVALRSVKPSPGQRKEVTEIPPPRGIAGEANESKADAGSVSLMDKTEEDAATSSSNTESQSTVETEKSQAEKESVQENAVEEEKKGEDEFTDSAENDSDSDEAVGHEQAAAEDRNLDDGENDEEIAASSTAGKVSEMFQRLLSMSGASGSVAGQLAVQSGSPAQSYARGGTSPYTFSASELHGGRMICTLPDHPIHAGATAVVAVMIGKTLMVANAGDSRAVLCRDGAAFALSYDHKPQQEREMSRIRKSGGFVNQFGRVNGNLNLSRSVGDLKYKQAYFLPPAEQMITAEPDVLVTTLDETDEFILIGCDGIWDCLTNEQAVHYVRSRIDTKTPTEIGKEMLDEIISVDPRATQGIGGDNMTIMIVDLQPKRRSYRQREE